MIDQRHLLISLSDCVSHKSQFSFKYYVYMINWVILKQIFASSYPIFMQESGYVDTSKDKDYYIHWKHKYSVNTEIVMW